MKIYLFIFQTGLHGSKTSLPRKSFQGASYPNIWEVLDWVQILRLSKALPNWGLGEATRGVQDMLSSKEMQIWATLAMQMFLDIKELMEDKGVLAKPLREYQTTVIKVALNFQKTGANQRLYTNQRPEIDRLYADLMDTVDEVG
ncbi:hypothetical protein PtrSN002B_005207 [Pyrenophora tritici-repentis]|nr:hypothetical protein PtrV1_01351 [Pyrenophora tritici-repentis]KAF7454088.1 hypothetical protein A1F99_013460 [Pyrenophora tritici-repentis]KAF7577177.1 hypothetical protein PtrM4_014170 [Pyrenophora tritici-repentis]KAG9387834.1 hypothetical protein A1F94_000726 [Pyrenophora tritici-repentis]KAI0578297.1 hypothetical protein Alg215_06429 [Pyrenophora tritici-repentis]